MKRMLNILIMSVISQYSVHSCITDCAVDGECESCCGSFNFEDKDFIVKRGDYAPLMEKVCHYLQQAQVNMWDGVDVQSVFFETKTGTKSPEYLTM